MAESWRMGIGTPRDDDMASARMLGGVLIFAGGFWFGVAVTLLAVWLT